MGRSWRTCRRSLQTRGMSRSPGSPAPSGRPCVGTPPGCSTAELRCCLACSALALSPPFHLPCLHHRASPGVVWIHLLRSVPWSPPVLASWPLHSMLVSCSQCSAAEAWQGTRTWLWLQPCALLPAFSKLSRPHSHSHSHSHTSADNNQVWSSKATPGQQGQALQLNPGGRAELRAGHCCR